jgi:hypothetical protein
MISLLNNSQKMIPFIKNFIIVTFIVTIFTNCSDFDQTLETRIDPKLRPYVKKFMLEADKHNVLASEQDLIVEFVDVCDNCLAKEINAGAQRHIIVRRDVYKEYTKDSTGYNLAIENLIFHELGHAILLRPHTLKQWSIMRSGILLTCYQKNDSLRTVLVNELFSNK